MSAVAGTRDGVDPDEIGPIKGAIAIAMFAAIVGFAHVLAPVPALIATLVSGGVAVILVRRSAKTWEAWCAASVEISGRSMLAQFAFVFGCILVAGAAEAPAIKAAAIAVLGSPCLVFAANGFRLMVDYRRRRRALRPYAR